MELQTERFILRPASLIDGAFIYELMNTEDWKRFIGDRNILSIQDAEQYIADKMLPQFEEFGYGNFIIRDKNTNESLGSVGLYRRPGLEGVDLGFAMLPKNYKKGIAYEASVRILEFAKSALKLSPIQAITMENNLASQSLILKLGFTFIDQRKIEPFEALQMYYKLQ